MGRKNSEILKALALLVIAYGRAQRAGQFDRGCRVAPYRDCLLRANKRSKLASSASTIEEEDVEEKKEDLRRRVSVRIRDV